VRAAVAIFKWELPEVAIPEANGVALLIGTVKELCHYVWPALLVPFFNAWFCISWGIVTPFAVAGSCIREAATTVYNFKLPPTTLPDMSGIALIPALPREFLRNLPKPSLPSLSLAALPPFSGLPAVKSMIQAASNIDFLDLILNVGYHLKRLLISSPISSPISCLADFLTWAYKHIPVSLLQSAIDRTQWRRTSHSIIQVFMSLLFGAGSTEIGENLDTRSVVWKHSFLAHWIVQWPILPFMITIHGLRSLVTIPEAAAKTLVTVAWPAFWEFLQEIHPGAFSDFILMVMLFSVIVG
jgi:hypothetical protein